MSSSTRRALLGAALAGCAGPRPPPRLDDAPADRLITVFQQNWHTEILLVPQAPLTPLLADFPGVARLSFGFGARDYFMARPEETSSFAAIAALLPGPAVVLASARPGEEVAEANPVRLPVTADGLAATARFVWDSFAKDEAGQPIRLAPGPGRSFYYAAAVGYSATYTCNTWTAEALQASGLPIDADGVLFASQVLGRARATLAAS